MTTEGYSAVREPPEELDDSKVMIKRLAQFHAASFYLVENVSCDGWKFLLEVIQKHELSREESCE